MQSRADILRRIHSDTGLMGSLRAVATIDAPDCWIAAGAIRNLVWAELHKGRNDPVYKNDIYENDIDVIYFDADDIAKAREKAYEAQLKSLIPHARWEVRNQARMHVENKDAPYTNCRHALEYWLETATAIGARLKAGKLELLTPYGVDDLLGLILRQTPKTLHKRDIYEARIEAKHWRNKWPKLTII